MAGVSAGANIPLVPVEKSPTPGVIDPRFWKQRRAKMFRGKDVDEINDLKREGLSIRAISELTGYDRKTIRKYSLEPTARPVYGPRAAPKRKLEPSNRICRNGCSPECGTARCCCAGRRRGRAAGSGRLRHSRWAITVGFVDEFRDPAIVSKTAKRSAAWPIRRRITASWRYAAATRTQFIASD